MAKPTSARVRRAATSRKAVKDHTWRPLDDQRDLNDEHFYNGLNLHMAALKEVADAWRAGDVAAADAALLKHFRTRKSPRITAYHTDHWWNDSPDEPVEKRADAVLARPLLGAHDKESPVSRKPHRVKGKPNPKAALDSQVTRQYYMGTLHAAWIKTHKKKYAVGIRQRLEAFFTRYPFVIDPNFFPDEFSLFGGPVHPQLHSCYKMFAWGDLLRGEMFKTPGVLPDEFWLYFIKNFWFHCTQFSRFVGAPFRADNHHLMERGVTCYFIGVQFPEFRRAAAMERYSRGIIRKHFDHNALADGTGSEHCSSYQYRCFLRYAMADSVARLNGRDLLGKRRAALLKKWLLFQGMGASPEGALPDVGDGAGTGLEWVISQSGAMYGSAVLKGIAKSLRLRPPVNEAYAKAYAKVKAKLPKATSVIYPRGGHLFLRDSWKPTANYMWLSLKNENLFNVHTHWDTLSFVIHAHGRKLIGDPISRTYGQPRGLDRGYYFSMDAHNSLVIDDNPIADYRMLQRTWGEQPSRIQEVSHTFSGDYDFVSAAHDGYRPLIHRRSVLFVRGRYFIITDGITMDFTGLNSVFVGTGDIRPHEYCQNLHFEEGVPVKLRKKDNSFVTTCAEGPNVLVVPEPFENLQASLEVDSYFQRLSQKHDTCRLGRIIRDTIGPCMFSTVYRPFKGKAPNVSVETLTPLTTPYRQDEYHGIVVRDGASTDYWALQRDLRKPKTIEISRSGATIRTDAAAVFVSTLSRGKTKGFRIGGRFVELNGKALRLPTRKLERFATQRA
ncbi:MAG: heparinase II/III family protein [Planctomycetes bacterium]|nr:heparinase II/III family protein [Planctomycetota bacterium]